MDKILVCMWDKFVLGGIETCYMGMFSWANQNGYKPILLIPQNGEYNEKWNEEIKKNNVGIVRYNYNDTKISLVDLKIDGFSIVKIVTASIHDFLLANYIRKSNRGNIDVYFYVLHPLLLCGDIENNLKRKIYEILFIKPLWNNGLIYMDGYSYECMIQMYKLKKKKFENPIIILPGKWIPEKKVLLGKKRNIISACRMVFPFKSYVLSLIDDFTELVAKYPEIELTLIGDGEDFNKLKYKVEQLQDNIQNKIHLLGNLEHEKMLAEIEKSYVFVGHGTSVVDAALVGVPSILVPSYQDEGYSVGIWDEMPYSMGVMKGSKGWDKYKCVDLLDKILAETDTQYQERCTKVKTVVSDLYDINKNVQKMLSIHTHEDIRFLWLKMLLDIYYYIRVKD